MSVASVHAGEVSDGSPPGRYLVVARRYRPQTFQELIGQEHVAQALSNAISSGRVGHAYLFTGARGVGKTSAARILAKALNCQRGPSTVPCNECELCRSISAGEDVDVLEIDGASNRGIDEIRQLRQNVSVRPSRARFKIYIIDEVHMLTREAFNALLKTLEEPPEHVKFIFCTTEPAKIPITILSRCQRFDFGGIGTASIAQRLQQIVEAEGVQAEPAALETIARRAAGSMRDSQSLLEQLLAFCPGRVELADVHRLLGTAGDEALSELVECLSRRDVPAALAALDTALAQGVDVAQLLEQLLGYLRDCMVAAAGCPAESLLYCSATSRARVAQAGQSLGLRTTVAAMQILDQALARMRFTTQTRVVAELALVRIGTLADMELLADVLGRLPSEPEASGVAPGGRASSAGPAPAAASAAAPAKKKYDPPPAAAPRSAVQPPRSADEASADEAASVADEPPPVWDEPLPGAGPAASAGPTVDEPATRVDEPSAPAPECRGLTAENVTSLWSQAVGQLSGMLSESAREFHRVVLVGSNRLSVRFRPKYGVARSYCQQPEQLRRIEQALKAVSGQEIRVEFALEDEKIEGTGPPTPATPQQRLLAVAEHPLVRRAETLFGAHPVRVEGPR